MLSRRPRMASPTTRSAPPSPYISAVSMWVIPSSIPVRRAATSRLASARRSPIFHVPWPMTGTATPVAPNGRKIIRERLFTKLLALLRAERGLQLVPELVVTDRFAGALEVLHFSVVGTHRQRAAVMIDLHDLPLELLRRIRTGAGAHLVGGLRLGRVRHLRRGLAEGGLCEYHEGGVESGTNRQRFHRYLRFFTS